MDLVVAEIAPPRQGDDWKAAMRRRGVSAYEVLMRHRWACPLLISRVSTDPAMMAYVDSTLGVLRAAGFSIELADHAWNVMDDHIYGHALRQLVFPVQPGDYGKTAREHLATLPPEAFPHLGELGRYVAEGHYDGIVEVTFGLDLILDGLERLLRR